MSAATAIPVNHWPDNACAKAFWGQRELPSYRQLLADTVAWLDVKPGQHWLDLGCGGGQLTRAIWEKSAGSVSEVVALDCAAANAKAIHKLRGGMNPPASEEQVRFLHADFSHGLAECADDSFDGAVSGLAIQYAESYDGSKQCWTSGAYDWLLSDVCRVLKPGGTFVFSVNIPEPSWGRVAFAGVLGFFRTMKPIMYLKNAARMWRYGRWLKQQARLGRFHYLPHETVERKLHAAGFMHIQHRLSFARQAYVFRCRKPS